MQELKAILAEREAIYKLLGNLYQTEVTAELLPELKKVSFPDSENNEESINTFIEKLTPEELDDLAADYARTFLGAGVTDEPTAYPIESVYTSKERLIMQDAYEAVLRILRKHGMRTVQEDLYPDHIGVELEFMGFLSAETVKALDAGDTAKVEELLTEQKDFLEKHLLNWTGKFLKDQQDVARTSFYKGLAGVTGNFLKEDSEWLSA